MFSQDDATNYTVTVKENPRAVDLTINATANATTLLTLTSGNTDNLVVGDRIMHSTNTDVVNTGISSEIDSIINSTAVTTNVDVIIANGDCTVYAVKAIKTITIQPGKEMFLEKSPGDWVESDESTNVVAVAVAYSS